MGNWDNSGGLWLGVKEVTWTPDGGAAVYIADQMSIGREYSNTQLKRRAANQNYPRVSIVTEENKVYTVKTDDVKKIMVTSASSFAVDQQGTLEYTIPGKGDNDGDDVKVSVTCTVKEVQLSEANGNDPVEVTIQFEAAYEDGSGDPETVTSV